MQQARGAPAVATAQNILDTKLGKSPGFRGQEARWQEWYFKFSCVHPVCAWAAAIPTLWRQWKIRRKDR